MRQILIIILTIVILFLLKSLSDKYGLEWAILSSISFILAKMIIKESDDELNKNKQ